jgi:hypothetical protein
MFDLCTELMVVNVTSARRIHRLAFLGSEVWGVRCPFPNSALNKLMLAVAIPFKDAEQSMEWTADEQPSCGGRCC